jgi:predicted MFS family arabinose efflux permease
MSRDQSALTVLKARNFRRYFIGSTASGFGDSLTPFALAFAVLHLTGSPSALGLVVLSTRLPIILFALIGGAVGDRFSRRTIMLVTDAARFLVQAATATILLTGVAQVWMIIVLQLIASAGAAFFNPAAQGLVPSVVDRSQLQQANSLLATSRSAASIFAVGTAGALVALADPGWAIAFDSLTFLISALYLARLPRNLTAEHLGRKTGLIAGIRTGLGEVRNRTWLWVWVAHAALINLLVVSPIFVLGPFVAQRYLGGAPAWAAVGISYTIGAFLGGLISTRWKSSRPMAAALFCFLLMVPMAVALAVPAPVWLIVAASLLGGLQVSIYNVFQSTAVQSEMPNDLIARATSVLMVGSLIAVPVGTALAGPIASALGTRAVLGGVAVITLLLTAASLAVPAVWRIRSVASEQVEPAPTAAPDLADPIEGVPDVDRDPDPRASPVK